jgi:hypothetical protein
MRIKDESLSKSENQYAVYEACLFGGYRRVVVAAGRKFGKTFISARVSRDWAAENPGEIILIGAPEYKYLSDETVPELEKAIPPDLLYGGSWSTAYHKTDHVLTLKNKAKIMLRSMDNPDSVRPLTVAGLIAEEFSLWTNRAWDECVKPTLMVKNPPALFIFTPKGMNQAYELWTKANDGKVGYIPFHFTSYDGPTPKENVDLIAEDMPEGLRQQEIYAKFLEDLGGVFQGVRECIAGDREDSIKGEQYVIGADVAATTDFNVATVMRRSSRAVVEQIRFTGVEPETVAERFKGLSDQYNQAVVWIDETGLGWGVADRVRTMGAPVKPYKFGAETKRQLIANLIMAISGRTIRYPDFPELVNELQIYQSKQLPSGTVQYSAPSGYHDDCVIALGLAVWGLGGGPPVYTPVIKDEGYL